jgi:2'-5' RNA ligase
MIAFADYLIIITLPHPLAKELGRYKRASANIIGHFEGMHSNTYITITHQVRCKPFLAQPALSLMGNRLSTMPPVELYVNGFSFVSHGTSLTIFAQIEMTERAQNWFKLLSKQMAIKVMDFVPQLTIARNIPIPAFNKLWPKFANRKFKYPFIVNNITILQRDTYGEINEWTVYKEMHFGNRMLAF